MDERYTRPEPGGRWPLVRADPPRSTAEVMGALAVAASLERAGGGVAGSVRLGRNLEDAAGEFRELWLDDPLSGQVLVGLLRTTPPGATLVLRDVGAAPGLEHSRVAGLEVCAVPGRVLEDPELLADAVFTTRDELKAHNRPGRRGPRPGR